MPNWIKGTLKLRGKQSDIRRFLCEGLEPSNWPDPKDRENQIVDICFPEKDDVIDYSFRNEPHIKGTRRAFITDSGAEMEEAEGVVCVDVKQAWAFDAGSGSDDLANWKAISDKYNLDLKLYGIECGMEFTQEVIILRGRKPISNERTYEDWMWDCPFPNMGG